MKNEYKTIVPREIATEEFVLIPLEEADPQSFLDFMQGSDIQRFIPWASDVVDIRSAKRRLSIPFGKDHLRYGIYIDDSLVGYIGAWRDKGSDDYETGSAIAEGFRGNKLSNKAFKAILPVLAELGAKKISCNIDENNEASKANIKRRGLHPTEQFNDKGERRWEMTIDA